MLFLFNCPMLSMLDFGTTKQYSEHLHDHGTWLIQLRQRLPLTAMFMVLNTKVCYKILWSQNIRLVFSLTVVSCLLFMYL